MSLAGCAFAHRAAAAAFLAFAGWACFSSGSCHVDGAMFCLLVSSCGRLAWARRYSRTHSLCCYRAELWALAAYLSFFYVSSAVRPGRKVQFEDYRAFSCGVQLRQMEPSARSCACSSNTCLPHLVLLSLHMALGSRWQRIQPYGAWFHQLCQVGVQIAVIFRWDWESSLRI